MDERLKEEESRKLQGEPEKTYEEQLKDIFKNGPIRLKN